MATISNNTIVSLIDTQTNSGTVVLPKTSDIPYRAILFKDLYGTFDTKPLTLNTQSPDVFEDGTSVKRFSDKFSYLTLYADTSHSKWVVLSATQNNSITVSTLNGVQTGYISSLNVNALTFASGNGWLDLTALRAVLVSTIQIDSAIGNFSSISGNGSQIVALNAISSLSLQSTVVGLGNIYLSSGGATQVSINSTIIGLGTFGYLSTNTVPSTIVGLGTFGYLSTNTIPSTIVGLGTFGYLSTNTVPSTIVGLGTFGYLSTNTVPSTIVGLGTFGYLSTNTVPSTIVGLGTFGYLSTNTVPSTIVGLGTFGYLSTNTVPSTIVGLGTFGYLSTNTVPSTIVGLGTFGYISSTQLTSTVTGLIDSPEVQSTIIGLGTFGYLSTNTVPSTIVGLGTFGYISSTQLTSTVTGLGNIYMSSFNGSTTYLSTAVGFISSLTVNSLTVGTGLGYVDFGAIRAVIVSSIQTNTGLLLASSLTGDGSQIYNLNAISSLSLQSTVTGLIDSPEVQSTIIGLGTFGYISSTQLYSTVTGLIDSPEVQSTIIGLGTFGYLSTNTVPSTIVGLGTFGYLSTNTVPSTIVGLGTFGYLSTNTVPSTIVGLGTFGYLSTNTVPSTIVGLGTFGYLSTNTVPSTIVGLGTFGYLSTNTVPSTIVGLGTFGYISSTQLYSTVTGLIDSPEVQSTIIGLGTFGYISSTQLTSTVTGLGNIYMSSFNGSTNFISSGQGFISSLTVNSLTFGPGNGWLDLTALRAILVSTIQIDAGIGNFSSISGNGSQIVNLNAISSLSLQSTIVGLGTFGYLSTNTVPSTIVGLGTFGYLSTNTVPSTIVGLGTFGYLSTNTVPSTIVGLGTFGYLSSFNSISSLNISTGNLFANIFTTNSVSTINISSASNYTSFQFANSYNGTTIGDNINMNGGVFPTSGAGKDLGSITNRWNNFWVSTISSIHTTTSTLLVQNTITASTLNVGAATGTNLAFFNISTNNITGFNIIGTTILSTQAIFCSSLQIGPADAILDILGPLRTQDISTLTCQASTLTANTITINRIFGGPLVANGTTTQNLNPFTIGAQIGFGSNTGDLGFYSEGHFRSTFTQTIQPTLDNNAFSNIVRINGNISSQNIFVSSIVTNNISAGIITVSSISGDGSRLLNLNAISSLSLQSTVVGLGTFGYISSLSLQSTVTGLVDHQELGSTIVGLGTFGYLSTNTVPSTIVGLGTFGYLSTNTVPSTIVGLGTFGYLSTNTVPSTIVGLGTFGYLSTNTVPSTIVGLGTFGYLSTNTVPSTIVGLGTFGYLSTNTVPSTIVGLGTFGYLSTNTVPSTIVGLGTFGYLSTNTVPSTIVGLGTFGYISSTQLISTVTGLGNIYMSSFTGSTNFISSGQGFISSLTVNSLTFGPGNGWLDLTALRAILVSTIQIDSAIGNFSSISGNGSQIVNLNAISSLSLQSTIVGLGTFGYISSTQLTSTVRGLGNIYMSTFTGSTNFISSGQGSIYTLNTSSIITEYITTEGGILTFSNADLIPSVDDTYNLGSVTNRWRELYVAGTSIHLGNSLVLSEDDNGFLSTNAMIVSSINVENLSTGIITTQFMEYKSDSLGGIVFTINNESATSLGILDNSYDFSIFNIANTNINLTAPNIKIDGELDLVNNSIKNVNTITTEYISSSSGVVTISNADLIPSLDDAYNLGSATNRWRELYVAGTSIHLGNSLVLSEDLDGKLSTNAMIVSSINVENLSTGIITTQAVLIETPGGISFFTGDTEIAFIAYNDNNMSLTNSVGDISISATNINIDGNVDLESNNINNVNTTTTENIASVGGTITVNNSHFIPSADDTYNLGSATNRWRELYVAGTSIHLGNRLVLSEDRDGKLSTNTSIFTPGLDLDNNAISNVLQITHISSATTNLCLPTYKLITTTKPEPYDNSAFSNILVNPNYFTHVMPFNKYRVQLNFNALLDTPGTSFSYFYFTLSNYNSTTVYPGSIYSATRPYVYLQQLVVNTAFNFTDMFDMSAAPPNIGDSLYVVLYAKNYDSVSISYSNINCFVITEPVV